MIVQKYGGSSVGTPEKIKKVARRIAEVRRGGEDVVVVVSAMGDTTDELVALASQVSPTPSSVHQREMDMLLTAGERISMALLSMALRDQGQEAISFTGSQAGIITDESHTQAQILEIRPARIKEELAKKKVVIVAGFQGVSRSKEVTTLGRGGSDTTAVALAGALGASRCEVFTDVPGVFSADPRIVPTARRYEELPLDLVFEMAVQGAQVMHARSIEVARQQNLSIYVGLAHSPNPNPNPRAEGTMLVPARVVGLPAIVAVTSLQSAGVRDNSYKERMTSVSVIGYGLERNHGISARVLELLAAEGIPSTGLTMHPQSITVCFAGSSRDIAARAVQCLHREWFS